MSAQEKTIRKLSAILSADVKGYSRLMTDNESLTIQTLKAYQSIMAETIKEYSGRVIDTPGDNLLAEFSSAVNAVQCSVEIQKVLKEKNIELSEDKRLEFRIGVNIGDVVQDGDRLYGEGVNIAARIEGLADPGGVCISRNAYDHVKNKLKLGYEYFGEHSVKNIKDPVRVYKILMAPEDAGKLIGEEQKPLLKTFAWSAVIVAAIIFIAYLFYQQPTTPTPEFEPASIEKMDLPLPNKPSIAVLAFDNMTGDKEQDYFSDGLAEEIITALASVPELFVIARNSSFAYKGKPIKVQQISEELGVQYVLEGSVRKSGEKMRITAQLIDTLKGHHLWAETYDRKIEDLFAVQEEITIKVITELQVKLVGREEIRLRAPCSENLRAFLKYLKGLYHFSRFTREDNNVAMRLVKEAIALDPGYACAYSALGLINWYSVMLGSSKSPEKSLATAQKMVDKAIDLNPSLDGPHAVLGYIYSAMGKYEQAILKAEESLTINPNGVMANAGMGYVLTFLGRSEEAIPFYEKLIRLDPFSTYSSYRLGVAYFLSGQNKEAISECKKAINNNPDDLRPQYILTAAYCAAGLLEEAKTVVSTILKMEPKFTLENYSKMLKFKNPADKELIISNLRKAGLPDRPPLKLPDKPSIAVLPFVNISNDPEQEYFADGITDDLITAISKISGIFVISRNSVFTFKDKAVKIHQVAKELNVSYVVEGSVRRAGDTIRVNAQLIDASSDHHLWAEKYDAPIEDIFSVQDSITQKIISELSIKLTDKEQGQLASIETPNIQAYDLFLQGKNLIWQRTPESYAEASILFKKAIEIDPNYSRVYAEMAGLYWFGATYGAQFWKKLNIDYGSGRRLGMYYLNLAMKNPTSKAHQIAMHVALARRQFAVAADEAQKAIKLNPNDSEGYASLTYIYKNTQPEKAISCAKMAAKLDPQSLWDSLYKQGQAYFLMKDYEKAVEFLERVGVNTPRIVKGDAFLPAAYAYVGRDQDARRVYKTMFLKAFEGMPPPIPEHTIHVFSIQEPEMATLLINGLIKAGLPSQTDNYCRLSEDEKLSVNEIKELIFGKTWTGYFWFYPSIQWWMSFSEDGRIITKYGDKKIQQDFGFEDNKFYVLKDVKGQKLKTYWSVYRNKYGNYEQKSEYVLQHETFTGRFSVQKR